MKKLIFSNKFMVIICIMVHQVTIESAPLPLQPPLSVAQQTHLNDSRWKEDAQQANKQINHFVEPANEINYADYRYVGSHNAFTDHHFFKLMRQQDEPILVQLAYGVRGLMLDTYDWNQGWPFSLVGPSGAKVCLSHGSPGIIALTQKGVNYYQSLKYELRRVIEFMKANPQAIITIILENYADQFRTAQEIKEVIAEAQYDVLLKPADVPNKQWPTLGWMRENNKRLLIFTQRRIDTDVTFHQFSRMMENQYSTTNESKLCNLREECRNIGQELIAINNFPAVVVTTPLFITKPTAQYSTIKRIVTNCQTKGFASGRLFNGYWIDRVVDSCNALYNEKQKTVFEYVNELNENPNKTMP